jgi:hypothetical protein
MAVIVKSILQSLKENNLKYKDIKKDGIYFIQQ